MQSINVFEKGIGYLEACLSYYTGSCGYIMLYLVALIFIAIFGTKREKQLFLPSGIFLILTVYNPIAPVILDRFFDVNSEYYRFFWIAPIIVIIPYVFTRLIIACKTGKTMVITTVIICLICVLGGNFMYKNGVDIADNIYKMPDELIEISDIIHKDSTAKYPKVFLEYEYNMQMRQYDPTILLTIDREDYLYAVSTPYTEDMIYDADHPQYRLLASLVRQQEVPGEAFLDGLERSKTEYVVINKANKRVTFLKINGLKVVDETDNYIVFKYNIKEPYEFELVDYSEVY